MLFHMLCARITWDAVKRITELWVHIVVGTKIGQKFNESINKLIKVKERNGRLNNRSHTGRMLVDFNIMIARVREFKAKAKQIMFVSLTNKYLQQCCQRNMHFGLLFVLILPVSLYLHSSWFIFIAISGLVVSGGRDGIFLLFFFYSLTL